MEPTIQGELFSFQQGDLRLHWESLEWVELELRLDLKHRFLLRSPEDLPSFRSPLTGDERFDLQFKYIGPPVGLSYLDREARRQLIKLSIKGLKISSQSLRLNAQRCRKLKDLQELLKLLEKAQTLARHLRDRRPEVLLRRGLEERAQIRAELDREIQTGLKALEAPDLNCFEALIQHRPLVAIEWLMPCPDSPALIQSLGGLDPEEQFQILLERLMKALPLFSNRPEEQEMEQAVLLSLSRWSVLMVEQGRIDNLEEILDALRGQRGSCLDLFRYIIKHIRLIPKPQALHLLKLLSERVEAKSEAEVLLSFWRELGGSLSLPRAWLRSEWLEVRIQAIEILEGQGKVEDISQLRELSQGFFTEQRQKQGALRAIRAIQERSGREEGALSLVEHNEYHGALSLSPRSSGSRSAEEEE